MDTPNTAATEDRPEHNQGGTYSVPGQEFVRDTRYINTRIVQDGGDVNGSWNPTTDTYPVEPNRYRLIAAKACPWANRALIVRNLLGLQDVISVGMPGPTHDERSWTFDLDEGGVDPILSIHFLRDAYLKRFPDYPRGITVPAIVDTRDGKVVTNDYAQITEDLYYQWKDYHKATAPQLWPDDPAQLAQMRELMAWIFNEVNNGVYRAGFAGSQEAYDEAYNRLFAALDLLDQRLATSRFLMGDQITEADIRLFTTLARFDAVYHGHFKCNRNTLTEFPNLWRYARELYQIPEFGSTIDFEQIKQHYYGVQKDINPSGIVPLGPNPDKWLEPVEPITQASCLA